MSKHWNDWFVMMHLVKAVYSFQTNNFLLRQPHSNKGNDRVLCSLRRAFHCSNELIKIILRNFFSILFCPIVQLVDQDSCYSLFCIFVSLFNKVETKRFEIIFLNLCIIIQIGWNKFVKEHFSWIIVINNKSQWIQNRSDTFLSLLMRHCLNWSIQNRSDAFLSVSMRRAHHYDVVLDG